MASYKCRVDGEDLTQKVRAAVKNPDRPVVRVAVRGIGDGGWRVQVKCSKGHANVFSGAGTP